MSGVETNVITRGRTSGGAKREIVTTLHDCYKRLGLDTPNKIEIFISEKEALLHDFLRDEKFRLGITAIEEEDAVCYHDNWRGYPRISVSIERLSQFTKPARIGALRREVAHSILHGSLEYRIFKIPENCRQMAMIKGIESSVLEQSINNLAVAIKECEASKFLVEHDFIDCQAAFALEWLQSPKLDKSASTSAKADREARFIYKTALLKPILFSHPLLSPPKPKKISLEFQILLGRKIEELVEVLEGPDQNRLLQASNLIADNLTQDTHNNVDSALYQVMRLA